MIVSVIGHGSIGAHYVNILKSLKRKKLKQILVFDNSKNILKKKKKDKLVKFNDIKHLKDYIKSINLAIVATPTHLHFKYAKYFLENGVEVLVEKPVVLKKKHAEILSKISNKKKKRCWVTFQNRYNLALTKLKKDITNNKIGKINLVDCSLFWHRNRSYYKVNWRGNYKTDGGVLANQAIHLLDALIYIFGPVKYFNSIAGFNKKKLKAEDLILINLVHKNKIFSNLKATTRANNDYSVSMDVLGEKGRIIIKGISLNTYNYFNNKKLINDKKNSESFNINGKENAIGNGHNKIIEEFINKKKSSRNLEIQNNIYLLKLIHSIYYNINSLNKSLHKVTNVKSLWGNSLK